VKACVIALVLLAACAKPAPVAVPPESEQSVVLLPTEQLAPSFVAQQKLSGRYGEREFSLDVVVQLAQGKLVLVGLTPFGTRASSYEGLFGAGRPDRARPTPNEARDGR